MMGMGMPAEKPKNFRGSFRRLLGRLRPERAADRRSSFVLAIVSVTFAVIGPKILGNATNIIFDGVDRQAAPGRRDPGAGRSPALRAAARTSSPTCSRA